MWYGYLADAVVIAHIAYVGYVVLGQVAIWLGWIFRRQWARNFWPADPLRSSRPEPDV